MAGKPLHVVTGAFGYSGAYIARRLLDRGCAVRTLTASQARRNTFGGSVEAHSFNFDAPDRLRQSLEGAAVLYNTYWIRFNHGGMTFARALQNTATLIQAAKAAGVGRIVHISITNPSEDSPLAYFSGKAVAERLVRESGLSYAILRPALLFGGADILVNNIAWALRRFPVFGVFGNGRYRLRPIHVDDLAQLAVEQGERREHCVVNAVGPETFIYRELVQTIAGILGKRRFVVPVPPALGFVGAAAMGKLLGDVLLTWDEVRGLMAGLLYVDGPATGATRLTDWAREHAATLGRRYASELRRRRDRRRAYDE